MALINDRVRFQTKIQINFKHKNLAVEKFSN